MSCPNIVSELQQAVCGYAQALAADAINPLPNYNIDGQAVSRAEWRAGIIKAIADLNQTINAIQPFVVITKQVL